MKKNTWEEKLQGAEPAAPGVESSEDSSEEDEGGAVEIRPRAGAQGTHQVGFCLFFACLFVCLFVFVCL